MYIKFTNKLLILFFSFVFVFSTSLFATTTPPHKTVAITQIVDHPSANAVREGIIAALRDNGYIDGKDFKIIYENAQGSPVTAAQIAQKFVSIKPNVLVTITTPSTQVMVKADEELKIPLVFAAVTDPIASGVVKSLTHPGGHVTGVTDSAPIKQQLEVFKKILPNMKTLGIIYNPGDNSSLTPLNQTRQLAPSFGISLVEAPAFKTSDVPAAMKKLASQHVDAVFVPLDNTVLSAMDAVLKIAFQFKIPVFSSDSDSVTQGALASSGYTHFDTGYASGEMVVNILQGKNPGDIPVKSPASMNIYVNPKSADKLEVIIPDSLQDTIKLM